MTVVSGVARLGLLAVPALERISCEIQGHRHAVDAGFPGSEFGRAVHAKAMVRVENDLNGLTSAIVAPLSRLALLLAGVKCVTKADRLASAVYNQLGCLAVVLIRVKVDYR